MELCHDPRAADRQVVRRLWTPNGGGRDRWGAEGPSRVSSSLHRVQHVVHDIGMLTLRAEQDDLGGMERR